MNDESKLTQVGANPAAPGRYAAPKAGSGSGRSDIRCDNRSARENLVVEFNKQRAVKKTIAQNAISEKCDKIGKVNSWSRVVIRYKMWLSKRSHRVDGW